jgi:hypothetical protein
VGPAALGQHHQHRHAGRPELATVARFLDTMSDIAIRQRDGQPG